jgi:putative SOS response-associated peptidase YedK
MCGRYAIFGPVSRASRHEIEFLGCRLAFEPRYNAAPRQALPVLRAGAGGRELALLVWGLVPSWAADPAIGARLINARAETVAERPAFRSAFRRRRCLVPMSGFYEWKRAGGRRLPYFVRLAGRELFAAAGLYDYWPGGGGRQPIESYAILTTEANERMRPIHDRMPVILPESAYGAWLDPENSDVASLKALLRPYPAEETVLYPVGPRVNDVRNEGPELIEPARPDA